MSRIRTGALRRWMGLASVLFCLSLPATEAKDTPFGIGFTVANQNSATGQDIIDTLDWAAQVGSHVSIVWGWRKQHRLSFHEQLIPHIKNAGLKVVFQVNPTTLGKPDPPFGLPRNWANPETQLQYLANLAMIAEWEPDYINLCAEANLMEYLEPEQFEAYAVLYPIAYDLVKSISPNTKVGVSFLHLLWVGHQQLDLDERLGTLDWVGFTTYPDQIFHDNLFGTQNIADFPQAWYTVNRTAFPNTPILYTEVGWSSGEQGTLEEQAEYISMLSYLFAEVRPELVTWTLLHDTAFFQVDVLTDEQLAILDELGVDPQVLFNRFNGMGLLDDVGNPKPAWFEAMDLDFENPCPGPPCP